MPLNWFGSWCRPAAAATAAAAARARSRASLSAHTHTFTRCPAPTTHTHTGDWHHSTPLAAPPLSLLFPFPDIFVLCDANGCKAPGASVTLSHHFTNMPIINISQQMFAYILLSCLLPLVSHRLFSYWECDEDLSFCQVLHQPLTLESKGFYFMDSLTNGNNRKYLGVIGPTRVTFISCQPIRFLCCWSTHTETFHPFHCAATAQPLRSHCTLSQGCRSALLAFLPHLFSAAKLPVHVSSCRSPVHRGRVGWWWLWGARMKHAKLLETLSRRNTIKVSSGPNGTLMYFHFRRQKQHRQTFAIEHTQ